MKLVLFLWVGELLALAAGVVIIATCQAEKAHKPQLIKPPVQDFPNILDTMPKIVCYAIEEKEIETLENFVKREIEEKEKEFISFNR